jgi:hypothetical protein
MGISRLAGTPFGLISRLDTSRLRHRAGPTMSASATQRDEKGSTLASLRHSSPPQYRQSGAVAISQQRGTRSAIWGIDSTARLTLRGTQM